MAYHIDQQDYYFGAALSVFFSSNQDARPSLITSLEKSRCYEMISDTCSYSFRLYMKHSESVMKSKKDGTLSWSFNFNPKEKQRIQEYIDSGIKTFIILVCSEEPFKNTVIAVLTQKEYLSLKHKSTITIKWEMAEKQHKEKFTVPNRGNSALYIDCNRIEKKFTDIQDGI